MRLLALAVLALSVLVAACSGSGDAGTAESVRTASEWVTLDDGPVVVTQTVSSRVGGGELVGGNFVLTFADRENFRNDWEDEAFVLIDGEAQRLRDGPQIDGEATVRYRILEPDYGDGQAEALRLTNQQFREGPGESPEGPSELDEFAEAHEGAAGAWEFTVGRQTGHIYTVHFEVDGPDLDQTLVTEFRGYGEPVVVEPPP